SLPSQTVAKCIRNITIADVQKKKKETTILTRINEQNVKKKNKIEKSDFLINYSCGNVIFTV
ncbi:hypothetical protein, partial [Enterococcus faecium]|uniref:hypothetical protein n=1 Tax=Enterococcus faecium TaxID=1352 RepID=UPI001E408BCC